MPSVSKLNLYDPFKQTMLNWGFGETWATYASDFSSVFILLAVTVIIYYILKFIIQRILKRLIAKSRSKWDDYLYEHKVFSRLAMIVPPLVLDLFLPTLVA